MKLIFFTQIPPEQRRFHFIDKGLHSKLLRFIENPIKHSNGIQTARDTTLTPLFLYILSLRMLKKLKNYCIVREVCLSML